MSHTADKPFESSAQNFEDVVLWRALKGVKQGCFVDVGAFDPVADSISWSFYEQGWRGVLVEPVPALAAVLRGRRPEDIVIEAAAGAETGTATLFVAESIGNSTLAQEVAERVAVNGVEFGETTVHVAPLDDLLEDAGLAGKTIHFCTIDVEGTEADVLAGFDLTRWGPWILVIEATEPNEPKPSHKRWEDRVLESGYHFCLFDGVNRFYVHPDKAGDFAKALSYPACVFDHAFSQAVVDARRARELERIAFGASRRADDHERLAVDASRRADEAERVAVETSQRADEAERILIEASQRADELERRVDELNEVASRVPRLEAEKAGLARLTSEATAELSAIRATLSWRVTRPLRAVRGRQLRLRSGELGLNVNGEAGEAPAFETDTESDAARMIVEAVGFLPRHSLADGSPGPRFPRTEPGDHRRSSVWPRWSDSLNPQSGSRPSVEGGRRLGDERRTGTDDQPLVTYVTVVRNNAATLHRAIESVQNQTYPNVEHVILDGASTDGTVDVIFSYADEIDYFASDPDAGLYDALNKAIPLARGDLICVLNSDDWVEPGAADTAVNRLRSTRVPSILLTAACVRQNGSAGDEPRFFSTWYPALVHPGCYFTCADDCHNAIYATRSAYEHSGPYDASYEIAGDFNWIMSCLEAGVEFIYTNELTINYVMGGLSSDPRKHGEECLRTMQRRFPSLTREEAGGLHHSFFFIPTHPTVPGRPTDRAEFVQQLFLKHSEEDELLQAVAWALVHRSARY